MRSFCEGCFCKGRGASLALGASDVTGPSSTSPVPCPLGDDALCSSWWEVGLREKATLCDGCGCAVEALCDGRG